MKKLVLCSLATLMVPSLALAGNCQLATRMGTGDDWLNLSSRAFTCNVADGVGDRTCNHNDYVMVTGSHRIGNGTSYTGLNVYKCSVSTLNDKWEANKHGDIPACSDHQICHWEQVGTANSYVYRTIKTIQKDGSTSYISGTSGNFCKHPESKKCSENDTGKQCEHNGIKYNNGAKIDTCDGGAAGKKEHCTHLSHECKGDTGNWSVIPSTLQCENGYESNGGTSWDTLKCVKKSSGGGSGSCMDRKTAAGRACCRAGSLTKWTESTQTCECVGDAAGKKWVYTEGAETGQCVPAGGCDSLSGDAKICCEAGGTWNEATKTCDCGEGRKWDTAKKQCVQDNSNVFSDCIYRFNGKVKCANGNSVTINEQRPLTVAELGGIMSCDQFNNLYQSNVGKLNEFFAKYCAGSTIISIVTGPSAAELESAKSTLSAFFSAAQSNASVWKDSEGKFNKARLASDLTAGVVLGSVGGVVSGVVIKKNQVKKGFEALHCAVGGQKVADWGDEFNVGLR